MNNNYHSLHDPFLEYDNTKKSHRQAIQALITIDKQLEEVRKAKRFAKLGDTESMRVMGYRSENDIYNYSISLLITKRLIEERLEAIIANESRLCCNFI